MATKVLLLCYVMFHVFAQSELTEKHDTALPPCDGNVFQLCEGGTSRATPTNKSIKEEAEQNMDSKLDKAYTKMTSDNANYEKLKDTGKKLGLSTDETEAVRLYTMDSYKLHDELNAGLREGNNKYPALHYWLDSALKKLPKPSDSLFRGYSHTVNINNGTTLRLPGFSSTSTRIDVAKVNFSMKGCTIMRFKSSRQAASVCDLSAFSDEYEYVIPPTEIFNVYMTSSDDNYRYIDLQPAHRVKRDTVVVTLCGGCGAKTYSPFLIVLVLFHKSSEVIFYRLIA